MPAPDKRALQPSPLFAERGYPCEDGCNSNATRERAVEIRNRQGVARTRPQENRCTGSYADGGKGRVDRDRFRGLDTRVSPLRNVLRSSLRV